MTRTIRTRTTQTQTPDPTPRDKITPHAVSSPDDTRTQTRTRTQTDEPRRRVPSPNYPGGWFARRSAARAARRLATDEAIFRGAEAELVRLEAQVRGEIDRDEDDAPPARWERFAAGWPQWVLTAIVSVMASVGQIEFARANNATEMIWLFGHDITPWFAPAVFDLSVAGLYAFGMYVAVRYQASPWLAWGAGTAIGAVSVYTNTLHKGALLFAAASAVLIVSWLVRMIVKYRHLEHVKVRRASAKPRLLTSSLVIASGPTARRAWNIARRRPIATIAERMNKQGEKITERDLVIRAAELWLAVHADRVAAELRALGDPPSRKNKSAVAVWRSKHVQALRQAEIVAWDAVDDMLGIPVIQREGIRVSRVTYLEPPPPPVHTMQVSQVAFAAAPAAPALPAAPSAAPVAAPTPRQRIAATSAAAPVPAAGTIEPPVVVMEGRPAGNAGMNWLPLSEIPGLPEIDPSATCKCHREPEKWCGATLLEHVQRRGRYVRQIVTTVANWDARPERIGKVLVKEITDVSSSGVWTEVSWLFDQLRDLAKQQREGKNAAATATAAATVTAEVPES